jgi:anaerobic ribonucleoside-triphosphate reductase activating protein
MRIANYIQDSIVDGPGLRFTLFTQGCPHHCAGCHNPETHDPQGGKEVPVADIIQAMLGNPLTDGLTLSGGEPFAQPEDCLEIARAAREHGLNVWAWSGWTFEQLLADPRPAVRELLGLLDGLVDGPFVLAQRSLSLKWRGSTNQRVLDVPKSLAAGTAVERE